MITEVQFKRELVLAYVTAHAQALAENQREESKTEIVVEQQASRYADRRILQMQNGND